MIAASSSSPARRAQRRRLLRHALAARAASTGTEWPQPPVPPGLGHHLGGADDLTAHHGRAPVISTQPLPSTTAVGELYESLLSSRRSARERLHTMQEIEQRHRHTPLPDLVDLAVTGALGRATPDRDDVLQP